MVGHFPQEEVEAVLVEEVLVVSEVEAAAEEVPVEVGKRRKEKI